MNVKHHIKDNVTRIDNILGRKIYGNTNPFSKNLRGNMDIYISRAGTTRDRPRQYNDIAMNFKKHGCAMIAEHIPRDVVANIAKQHAKLIEDPSIYHLREDHKLSTGHARRTIYDAGLHIKGIDEFFTRELRELVEDCYKSYFDIMQVRTHRNYYVDKDVAARGIYSNKWHCDARKPSIYKIMTNLSDVTEQDGPFHIITKPRTRELLECGYIDRNNYGNAGKYIDDEKYIEKLVGPQSTAMICNTNECLHKAGRIEKGHYRDLMMIQMIPSSTPLTNSWIARKGYDYR
jgi:hypothetical protein